MLVFFACMHVCIRAYIWEGGGCDIVASVVVACTNVWLLKVIMALWINKYVDEKSAPHYMNFLKSTKSFIWLPVAERELFSDL